MPVFDQYPWLLYLCYLIAAMAVAYAIVLQLSLREGAKPVRGVVVWRDTLPEPLAAKLRMVGDAQSYRTSDSKGVTLDTIVTPEEGGFFVSVRRSRGTSPPAPYASTVRLAPNKGTLGICVSPLVPLIYLGLIIVVWTVMGGGWFAWTFAILVVGLFIYTIFHARTVVLEALKGVGAPSIAS